MLHLRGRPAAIAAELAQAMLDAGTLDEAWTVGMLQAGVRDGAMLAALRHARVSAQDLLLGNLNRTRYDGSGDRSGLIDVDTAGPLGEALPASIWRYVSRKHLKLDEYGLHFSRADTEPAPGVRYDIAPGELLFPQGQPPDAHARELAANREVNRVAQPGSMMAERRHIDFSKFSRRLPQRALLQAGHVELVETPVPPGQHWWGRSRPEHLVDGVLRAGEAWAWRPVPSPQGPPRPRRRSPATRPAGRNCASTSSTPWRWAA
ncbi:hypothetical protein [Roseateles chitinivorans]|uniref:hypothetical protein n=1 Tax=Roseateles chitinivorans TaxID=2917965 RepID=UPI003D6697EC